MDSTDLGRDLGPGAGGRHQEQRGTASETRPGGAVLNGTQLRGIVTGRCSAGCFLNFCRTRTGDPWYKAVSFKMLLLHHKATWDTLMIIFTWRSPAICSDFWLGTLRIVFLLFPGKASFPLSGTPLNKSTGVDSSEVPTPPQEKNPGLSAFRFPGWFRNGKPRIDSSPSSAPLAKELFFLFN